MLQYDILYIMPRIVERNCDTCGNHYRSQNTRFCSPKCYFESRKGHQLGFKRGQASWNKGIKWPELSEARKGAGNPAWKGGITYRQGYKFIKMPNHPNSNRGGYIAEHRLVMEKKIGRYLETSEQVHHLDYDKTNNSSDNLIILTRSEHLKLHRNNQKDRYK